MKKLFIPIMAIALFGFGCMENIGFDLNEDVDKKVVAAPVEEAQAPAEAQVIPSASDTGNTGTDDFFQVVDPEIKPVAADLQKFADLNNSFAFRLYQSSLREGKNLFFSPYSISTALSMAFAGARKQTADEMVKALSFELPSDVHHQSFYEFSQGLNEIGKRDQAQLSVANGIFQSSVYEKLLLPEFQAIMQKQYDSRIESLDFSDAEATAKYINDWVLKRTNDRIKDLVSPRNIEDSNDGMVLVNAIFFKGNWAKQFDPKDTMEMPFYPKLGRSKESAQPVQMMYTAGNFGYFEFPGGQVLELPYDEKDLTMLILLPDENAKTQPELTPENYEKWRKSLWNQKVHVNIPRFKMELTLEGLVENLKEMGMRQAFSSNEADFTGIRDPKGGADLFISDVIHKAFVEVNEKGTEAAAATAVVMATKSAMIDEPPTPVFMADHPFTYMIIHKPTGSVLFIGKLVDPPNYKD